MLNCLLLVDFDFGDLLLDFLDDEDDGIVADDDAVVDDDDENAQANSSSLNAPEV